MISISIEIETANRNFYLDFNTFEFQSAKSYVIASISSRPLSNSINVLSNP